MTSNALQYSEEYSKQLADLIAKNFIQRKDVKAVQHGTSGAYRPVKQKWTKGDLRAHVNREKTYGHYLLDQDSLVKLFAFDIDLDKEGHWIERPDLSSLPNDSTQQDVYDASIIKHESNPREDWKDRKHPGRWYYKHQLRLMGEIISSSISRFAELKTACAYSGNKGIHVYGFFPQPVPARIAREVARRSLEFAGTAMDPQGRFTSAGGDIFYKYEPQDAEWGLDNLSIELFPKQDTIKDGHYGNLMRLPLGRNLKNPKDPCFFIDQTLEHTELAPHPDPVQLLRTGNPWKDA